MLIVSLKRWLLVIILMTASGMIAESPALIALENGDSLSVNISAAESWGVWLSDGRVVRFNVMLSLDTDDQELANQVESLVSGVTRSDNGPMAVRLEFKDASFPVHRKYVEKPGHRRFMMYFRGVTKRPERFGMRFRYTPPQINNSIMHVTIASGRKTVSVDAPDGTNASNVFESSGGELGIGGFLRRGTYDVVYTVNAGVYSVASRILDGNNQTSSQSMTELNFPLSFSLEVHNYIPSRRFAFFFGARFYANNLDVEGNDGRLAGTLGFGMALN